MGTSADPVGRARTGYERVSEGYGVGISPTPALWVAAPVGLQLGQGQLASPTDDIVTPFHLGGAGIVKPVTETLLIPGHQPLLPVVGLTKIGSQQVLVEVITEGRHGELP